VIKSLRKGKRKRPASLMLTPLLDMFTIILIFLIMSFDTEDYGFQLNEQLEPPQSTAESIFKRGVNVAITREGVDIEKARVLPLADGKATDEAYETRLSAPLVERFGAIYQERFAADDVSPDEVDADEELTVEDDAILIIQADRDLDYRTIHLVMNSAREAGFYKYRLAVIRK